MDMLERRIREVVATLLSRGAKALERTAGELEQAASELRLDRERARAEAERAWSEEPRREPDTMLRSAPLRAVPDTPTDEEPDTATSWTPPAEPPRTPGRERSGDVDAVVTTTGDVAGPPDGDGNARIADIIAGTVTQARARLGELTAAELRRLREVEAASRGRTTLLAAIDRALETAE